MNSWNEDEKMGKGDVLPQAEDFFQGRGTGAECHDS